MASQTAKSVLPKSVYRREAADLKLHVFLFIVKRYHVDKKINLMLLTRKILNLFSFTIFFVSHCECKLYFETKIINEESRIWKWFVTIEILVE